MEAPKKSQTKLTRTQSSLLRCSSPTTTRSSAPSFASVNVDDFREEEEDEEEEKPKQRSKKRNNPNRKFKPGSIRFLAGPVFCFIGASSLFFFLGGPTSENVLLALIFVAVALYLVNRNKGL